MMRPPLRNMNQIDIRFPVWNGGDRVVGVADFRVQDHNKIVIGYVRKDGTKSFPNPFYMRGRDIKKHPVQVVKGGVKLYLVPLAELQEVFPRDAYLYDPRELEQSAAVPRQASVPEPRDGNASSQADASPPQKQGTSLPVPTLFEVPCRPVDEEVKAKDHKAGFTGREINAIGWYAQAEGLRVSLSIYPDVYFSGISGEVINVHIETLLTQYNNYQREQSTEKARNRLSKEPKHGRKQKRD